MSTTEQDLEHLAEIAAKEQPKKGGAGKEYIPPKIKLGSAFAKFDKPNAETDGLSQKQNEIDSKKIDEVRDKIKDNKDGNLLGPAFQKK